jgi:hypothetical protein
MKKILAALLVASSPFMTMAHADFVEDWRNCTTEPGIFIGLEPSELVNNKFAQLAGEIGYKFNDGFQARLTLMNFKVGNSNFIGDYGSNVITGGHVNWRSRGYELHLDNFFTQHWYYSFTAGRYHDSFSHDMLDNQKLEHRSNTLGVGFGYQYRNLFDVKNLYMNFDIPIRAYLDPIKETKLNNSIVRERTWSGNGWLFIGYQF